MTYQPPTYQAPRPVVGQRVQIWFLANDPTERCWKTAIITETDRHVEWMGRVWVSIDGEDLPELLINWSPNEVRAEDGSPLFGAP